MRPWWTSVLDLYEEESPGWSCRAGGVAVAGGEDLEDGVGGDASSSCFDEGSYQVADHMVEEA